MNPAALTVEALTVAYGDVVALDDVDLEVGRGETVAVLGPSGSGKSTLLHAIAGFLQPRSGVITIEGTAVSDIRSNVPPERRNVGMVFQHHALWPHLTVAETVRFPLERKRLPDEVATAEVAALLARLDITRLADRRPHELSGGEQQRVSLARALARHPALFLFDEPTAHLDPPLRASLLDAIDGQVRREGAAMVYASHDAGEAMALADRMVLVRDGRVIQVGTPEKIYEEPLDIWAARLTGSASVLPTESLRRTPLGLECTIGGVVRTVERYEGEESGVPLLRPEWGALGGPLPGVVDRLWFRGAHTEYRLATPAGPVVVREPGTPRAVLGASIGWDIRRLWLADRAE